MPMNMNPTQSHGVHIDDESSLPHRVDDWREWMQPGFDRIHRTIRRGKYMQKRLMLLHRQLHNHFAQSQPGTGQSPIDPATDNSSGNMSIIRTNSQLHGSHSHHPHPCALAHSLTHELHAAIRDISDVHGMIRMLYVAVDAAVTSGEARRSMRQRKRKRSMEGQVANMSRPMEGNRSIDAGDLVGEAEEETEESVEDVAEMSEDDCILFVLALNEHLFTLYSALATIPLSPPECVWQLALGQDDSSSASHPSPPFSSRPSHCSLLFARSISSLYLHLHLSLHALTMHCHQRRILSYNTQMLNQHQTTIRMSQECQGGGAGDGMNGVNDGPMTNIDGARLGNAADALRCTSLPVSLPRYFPFLSYAQSLCHALIQLSMRHPLLARTNGDGGRHGEKRDDTATANNTCRHGVDGANADVWPQHLQSDGQHRQKRQRLDFGKTPHRPIDLSSAGELRHATCSSSSSSSSLSPSSHNSHSSVPVLRVWLHLLGSLIDLDSIMYHLPHSSLTLMPIIRHMLDDARDGHAEYHARAYDMPAKQRQRTEQKHQQGQTAVAANPNPAHPPSQCNGNASTQHIDACISYRQKQWMSWLSKCKQNDGDGVGSFAILFRITARMILAA